MLGAKILRYREKFDLTQEKLAEKLGVSRQSVSKWELDQALPEIDKIIAMCRLFEITTDKLLLANEEMAEEVCQSCAMSFAGGHGGYGTNADGTKSKDYCEFCIKEGDFTETLTFEQAIESNIPYWNNGGKLSDEQARELIMEVFPKLKRWAENKI